MDESGHRNSFATAIEPPNFTGTPERRLLLAILERAILDYVGNEEREAESATQWLFGDTDETCSDPYSFAWVCHQLDLDATHIAASVRAMPKRGNRRVAPWYYQRTGTDG